MRAGLECGPTLLPLPVPVSRVGATSSSKVLRLGTRKITIILFSPLPLVSFPSPLLSTHFFRHSSWILAIPHSDLRSIGCLQAVTKRTGLHPELRGSIGQRDRCCSAQSEVDPASKRRGK